MAGDRRRAPRLHEVLAWLLLLELLALALWSRGVPGVRTACAVTCALLLVRQTVAGRRPRRRFLSPVSLLALLCVVCMLWVRKPPARSLRTS